MLMSHTKDAVLDEKMSLGLGLWFDEKVGVNGRIWMGESIDK